MEAVKRARRGGGGVSPEAGVGCTEASADADFLVRVVDGLL